MEEVKPGVVVEKDKNSSELHKAELGTETEKVKEDVKPVKAESKEVTSKAVESLDGEDKDDQDEKGSIGKSVANLRESLKQNFLSTRLGSFRAEWVVDMEREREGYTAGRGKTYCAMFVGLLSVFAMTVFYLMTFCRIELANIENPIGYGDKVFSTLIATGESERDLSVTRLSLGTVIGGFTLFGWIFVYIADVRLWWHGGKIMGWLGSFVITSCVALSFVTALLLTGQFAAFPYYAYMLLTLFFLVAVKVKLFANVQKIYYLRTMTFGTFISGVAVLIIYLVSVFRDDQYFDNEVSVRYHKLLDCPEDVVDLDFLLDNATARDEFFANGGVLDQCDEAFLVWAGPAMFFTAAMMFSGILFFLTRAEQIRIESKKPVGLEPAAQVFVAFIILSMLGLWVAASIASATTALGDTILSLSFYSLILMVGIAVAIFGTKYLSSEMKKTSIGKKAVDGFNSDWGKGLLIVTSLPIIIVFLFVDYLKQSIRRHTPLGKNITDPEEQKSRFTVSVARSLNDAKKWNIGSVITKALIFGMVFFVMSVGVSRMTIVFLSWLREEMFNFSLLQATFIIMGVGLVMFLLPPVPGVPVYITCGVVLPSLGEKEGISFGVGILYGIAISTILKLLALVMQQKIIGEMFGSKSVQVRYAVGINSVELRAMRKVLTEPGMSFKKVAVLCGGPDWPTSVLTGIMKLNVFEMLWGTTPIAFLIAPCVISGAMIVKSGEDDSTVFQSINTIAVFLTVIMQSGSMLAAAQVLANAAVKYEDELKKEEPDKEVLELEEKDKNRAINYKIVTRWENLGQIWKILHLFNLFLMIVCCYAFMLLASDLFITFDITDDIGDDLNGNAFNIVTETGWVFIAMFSVAAGYYFVFKNIHQKKKATVEQMNAYHLKYDKKEKQDTPMSI